MRSPVIGLLLTLASFPPHPAEARVWSIRPDGTGDAPTIQAGVDSADAGDEVVLAPGTYTWSTQWGGEPSRAMVELKPGVVLRSEMGAAVTILDAELGVEVTARAYAIQCTAVGTAVRIEGLTFLRSFFSAAITVSGASEPTIERCVFQGNWNPGTSQGTAISCDVATIEDCEFSGNASGGGRGAVSCGAARISNCLFRNNRVGGSKLGAGGAAISSRSAIIRDCLFESNRAVDDVGAGGGAIADRESPTIEHCVFLGNRAESFNGFVNGGAISCVRGSVIDCIFFDNAVSGLSASGGAISALEDVSITRCVFLANRAYIGGAISLGGNGRIEECTLFANVSDADGVGGIFANAGTVHRVILAGTVAGAACGGSPGPVWSCSDLFGNATGDAICGTDGGDNFSADPQFCAVDPPASRSVLIQSDSPCAPDHHPTGAACERIGAGDVGCEAVSVERTTWSRFKSRYRR